MPDVPAAPTTEQFAEDAQYEIKRLKPPDNAPASTRIRQPEGYLDDAHNKIYHAMLWFLVFGLRSEAHARGEPTFPALQPDSLDRERYFNFRVVIYFIRIVRMVSVRWREFQGPNQGNQVFVPERMKATLMCALFDVIRPADPGQYRQIIMQPGLYTAQDFSMGPQPFERSLAFSTFIDYRHRWTFGCMKSLDGAKAVWERIEHELNSRPVGLGGIAMYDRQVFHDPSYGYDTHHDITGMGQVPPEESYPFWVNKQVLYQALPPTRVVTNVFRTFPSIVELIF